MKPKLACYIILISIYMFSCNTAKTIIPSEPAQSSSNFEKLATIKNIVSIEKRHHQAILTRTMIFGLSSL